MTTDEIMAMVEEYAFSRGAHRQNIRSAIEAMQADAARYRWLKENCAYEIGGIGDMELLFKCDFENYNNFDKAIDAAMALDKP